LWIILLVIAVPVIANNEKVLVAAFSKLVLQDKSNSDVIEISPEHVLVLRVLDRKPASLLPLDSVRSAIENNLKLKKSHEKTLAAAREAKTKINAGKATVKDIVSAGVRLEKSDLLTRKDTTKVDPMVLEVAFNMSVPEEGKVTAKDVAMSAGAVVLVILEEVINSKVFQIEFTDFFSNGIDNFIDFSKQGTKLIQHGFHRYYILSIIIFTTILLWFQVYITRGWSLDTDFSFNPFYITGLVGLTMIATIFSLFNKSRITTIIAMGVVGYGISLIYLYYSAVDLAITQIIVETLTIVIFVIVLQRLPRFAKLSSRATKIRDLIIALTFGTVMTVLALKAIHVEFNRPISDFFIENSLYQAYGKNIVNVILVDFRALDTLGEITVLTIAAFGVFVLLTSRSA